MVGISDPEGSGTKLQDTLTSVLAQLTSINNRLDSHGRRLARTKRLLGGEDPGPEEPSSDAGKQEDLADDHRTIDNFGPRNFGCGGGGDGGGGPFRSDGRRDPRDREPDDWRRPHRPKLTFPRYDGEADPLPWLNKCDSYFRGCRTMDEEKVWLASLHLDGVAAEWYFHLECDVGIVSWPRFVEYVNLRFGPPIRSNALGELKELRRTGTVEEYQRQLLALLCRCDNLTGQHQVDLFTAGLG